ncbi:hypothetical protein GHC20_08035 [Brucella sp. 2280]|nr:hypothetical protein GHC20_08035 [Brucella sp. 2280]
MALFSVPVLMYVQYTPLRYSKITIFASACRFLIQTLSLLPSMLVLVSQKRPRFLPRPPVSPMYRQGG